MNKGFSRIVRITLIILLLWIPLGEVYGAIPEPTSQFYVNDYADVIDSEIENLLVHNGNLLNQIDGAQIVLVTVDFVGLKPWRNMPQSFLIAGELAQRRRTMGF